MGALTSYHLDKVEINARKLDQAYDLFARALEYQCSILQRDRMSTAKLLEQGLEIIGAVSANIREDF